jgi:hypothetical protein
MTSAAVPTVTGGTETDFVPHGASAAWLLAEPVAGLLARADASQAVQIPGGFPTRPRPRWLRHGRLS